MQRISQYLNQFCCQRSQRVCAGMQVKTARKDVGKHDVRCVSVCVMLYSRANHIQAIHDMYVIGGGGAGWGTCNKEERAHTFFSCRSLCSSSASSAVLTRISIGTGVLGFLSSTGGFGTHTTMTLFFPVREQGTEA